MRGQLFRAPRFHAARVRGTWVCKMLTVLHLSLPVSPLGFSQICVAVHLQRRCELGHPRDFVLQIGLCELVADGLRQANGSISLACPEFRFDGL